MNIIKNFIIFIKNIFNKDEEIKMLEMPKQTMNEVKKDEFIKILKISDNEGEQNTSVETLICIGDGLGIQKNLSC